MVPEDNGAEVQATAVAAQATDAGAEAVEQQAAEAAVPKAAESEPKPDVWALLNDVDEGEVERQLQAHPKLRGVIRRREESIRQSSEAAALEREQRLSQQWVTQRTYTKELQAALNDLGELDETKVEAVVGKLRGGLQEEAYGLARAALATADEALVKQIGDAKLPAPLVTRLQRAVAENDVAAYFQVRAEMLAEARLDKDKEKWIETGHKEERERLKAEVEAREREAAAEGRSQQRQPAGVNGTGVDIQTDNKKLLDPATPIQELIAIRKRQRGV